jgi:crotonobetainyl-CoA:carnitine CoA-transferase CaiB-like acyl-CoA transferase
MRTFGAPARWVGYDVGKLAPAPRLGAHTESVLRECGFDADALASLLSAGAARTVAGSKTSA